MSQKGITLFLRIRQAESRVMNDLLKAAGLEFLSGEQGRILTLLWKKDGQTVAELAKKRNLSCAAVTNMLHRMEKTDLVCRSGLPHDRRRVVISLSEKGRALEKPYAAVTQQLHDVFYHGFSKKEIKGLEKQLEQIEENLKAAEHP